MEQVAECVWSAQLKSKVFDQLKAVLNSPTCGPLYENLDYRVAAKRLTCRRWMQPERHCAGALLIPKTHLKSSRRGRMLACVHLHISASTNQPYFESRCKKSRWTVKRIQWQDYLGGCTADMHRGHCDPSTERMRRYRSVQRNDNNWIIVDWCASNLRQ